MSPFSMAHLHLDMRCDHHSVKSHIRHRGLTLNSSFLVPGQTRFTKFRTSSIIPPVNHLLSLTGAAHQRFVIPARTIIVNRRFIERIAANSRAHPPCILRTSCASCESSHRSALLRTAILPLCICTGQMTWCGVRRRPEVTALSTSEDCQKERPRARE